MRRPAAAAAVLAGAALAVVPFLEWFRVDVPDGRLTVTGVAASGALATLPVIGGLVVAIGVLVLMGRLGPRREGGTAVTALGSVALLWVVAVIARPPVRMAVLVDDQPRTVPAELVHLPGTVLAAAAAAAVVVAGVILIGPFRGDD